MNFFDTESVSTTVRETLDILCASKGVEPYPMPKIDYDLKGKTAGMAYSSKWKIRMNLLACQMHPEEAMATAKHEACHLFVGRFYKVKMKASASIYEECFSTVRKRRTRTVQPHGPEWKSAMVTVGARPDRCHSMNLPAARVVKKFKWSCKDCGKHYSLGSIRHNKQMKWGGYRCAMRACKRLSSRGQLSYSGLIPGR